MKKILLIAACFVTSIGAFAQGVVDFKITPTGVNAPVFDVDGSTKLTSAFWAQLYWSATGAAGSYVAVSDAPVPFRDGAGAGYWNPIGNTPASADSSRTVGVPAGNNVFLEVAAWKATSGATYEAANKPGGIVGLSAPIPVTTGGAGSPPSLPAAMTGLTSFSLHQVPAVPEPATLALGLVGAAALLLRRRK